MPRDPATDEFYRGFMKFFDAERAERATRDRRRRARESLTTMLLTTLATSLGLFCLAVLLAALAGHPVDRWAEPLTVVARKMSDKGMYFYSLPSDAHVDLTRVRVIHMPSRECICFWLVGLLLILPPILRRGVTRTTALSLAVLMPTAAIMSLLMILLGTGYCPSFRW